MRSHLSKSWIYRGVLVVSLLLTGLSIQSEFKHLQLSALVPFNSQPLFVVGRVVNLDESENCHLSVEI